MLRLTVCLVLVSTVVGFVTFQTKIPNGANVPNSCGTGNWGGVGHKLPAGTGARNLFGVAFKGAGTTWNTALCQADSDGDGKTNGAELGDPDCTWAEGQTPSSTTGITHPGICEPIDSDTCKAKNTGLTGCPTSSAGGNFASLVLIMLGVFLYLIQ